MPTALSWHISAHTLAGFTACPRKAYTLNIKVEFVLPASGDVQVCTKGAVSTSARQEPLQEHMPLLLHWY